MKNYKPVRPEDILADGVDDTLLHGVVVRKATLGAFLLNIDIVEDLDTPEQHKQAAINMMKELARGLVAAGLHKHATFKNPQVEQMLIEAEIALKSKDTDK